MSKLNLFIDTLDITDSDSSRVSKSEFLEQVSNDPQIRRLLYSRQVSVESLPIWVLKPAIFDCFVNYIF